MKAFGLLDSGLRSVWIALCCLSVSEPVLPAQEDNKPAAQPAASSVQQQLEELKAGQQRILKELEQLKRRLDSKDSRTDFLAKPAPPKIIPMNVQGEPFRGASQARVGMVEYSDFACSFCAEYVRNVYPRIEADYIKTGKIKYFFRDFPEPEHTNALTAAQAARCAGEQGKFWEMHDLLFAAPQAPNASELGTYAQALDLDTGKFQACLATGRWLEAIRRSAAGATRLGIYGTPAFLLGTLSEDGNVVRTSKVLVGDASFEAIKAALDELLARKPQ